MHIICVEKENQHVKRESLWNFRSYTLQNRFKMQKEGKTLEASERKIATGEQKQNQLADCIKIKTMCSVLFSPSLHKIKEIVR